MRKRVCLLLLLAQCSIVAAQEPAIRETQVISIASGGFKGVLEHGDEFGHAIAFIGDLNRDGTPDIAVTAPDDTDGGGRWAWNGGAVWILFLGPDGNVRYHQKISALHGNVDLDTHQFGSGVASLGDLDGDGNTDLAVGAYQHPRNRNEGAVYILFLNTDGTVKRSTIIESSAHARSFGSSIARLGDLDEDGNPDIVVGASLDGIDGSAWLVSIDSTGSGTRQIMIRHGFDSEAVSSYGAKVTNIGDVDGDGYPELAVHAGGAVHLLMMDFGLAVKRSYLFAGVGYPSGVGDIDGDGIPDMGCSGGIIFLNGDGSEKSRSGANLSNACRIGDVDGDGVDDLAMGVRGYRADETTPGGVLIRFMER